MKLTNFQENFDWNSVAGIQTYEKPQINIFTEQPDLINYRMSLIREEVSELEEAVKQHNMAEVYDALCDILYVVHGMGVSTGLNLDIGMDLVNASNRSKFCETEQEAIDSVEWYKQNESHRYDSPAFRKSSDDRFYIVYNQSTGKILKSINWKEVDFNKVLSEQV